MVENSIKEDKNRKKENKNTYIEIINIYDIDVNEKNYSFTYKDVEHRAIYTEDNPWKENVKDVDLNPEDQGKSLEELYKERTGNSFEY